MTTVTTKERPILFSGAMIRALLCGSKTQTRRVIKPQPPLGTQELAMSDCGGYYRDFPAETRDWRCPYGQPGDRLWVREQLIQGPQKETGTGVHHVVLYAADNTGVVYRDGAKHGWCGQALWQWPRQSIPSIHMPCWASRITLEVTGVRVERVQDITEEDAIAEGVDAVSMEDMPRQAVWSHRQDFQQLWNSINAKRGYGWKENPWVWVVEFRR